MENSLHILLTGDERIVRTTLKDYLCNLGHQVEVVRDGHTALKKINVQHYDLALVDLCMSGINDVEFLAAVQHNRRETPVVLISGDDTVRTLIEAFRVGAGSFLPQSIRNPNFNGGRDKRKRMADRSTRQRNPRIQNQCFVGNSSATQEVRERIRQAVEANVDTIFLTGETGTGKEVVAREIHLQASSEEYPFVAVNCSALPEPLVESELFGHVKGAFTDATNDRPGYFEMANSGTLFLDEIADLPLHTQAKLLRILDTRTLIRVGGTQEIAVQERVISALNQDPAHLIETGQLRDDLYYRLNVFSIHLKPLRARPEDILPLADHFLRTYTARNGRIFEGFAETLAQQACEIEIERLNQPIGKQDQYIAAYGGLRRIQFNRDESVDTQEISVAPKTMACLQENFTLFYTGIQRRAETILHEQKRSASPETLVQMRELVPAFYDVLVNSSPGRAINCPTTNLSKVGHLLHRTWHLKRSLCGSISNPMLDTIYERAIAEGALGGKILGAGGGGYFLFYVPKERQGDVTAALSDLGLLRLAFRFEPKGSQVIERKNPNESHYPHRRQRHTTQTPHLHFP